MSGGSKSPEENKKNRRKKVVSVSAVSKARALNP